MNGKPLRILLVDDEAEALEYLQRLLRGRDFVVFSATNGQQALQLLEKDTCDVCLTDLRMPEMEGIELLEELSRRHPQIKVIILTGYGTVENAVEAVKKGAYDYILKPVHPDELLLRLERVRSFQELCEENRYLQQERATGSRLEEIIGEHPNMKRILETVQLVAGSQSTVLIQGESGTGKELIAKALHYCSPRSSKPFIRVSCGALPEGVLESELFGHEKGAFTGAVQQRKGRFELAHRGTIFLDEIGDVSAAVQVKLLRVLQEREIERVGGNQTIPVDVRVVAASNKDLRKEVASGAFREDLLYRLNVIVIEIPPLRERLEDLPLLISHFLSKFNLEMNKNITGISEEARRILQAHSWPGNVRELENVIERAMVFCKTGVLGVDDLPQGLRFTFPVNGSDPLSLKDAKFRFERDFLERTLSRCQGNISRSARSLKIARKNLQDKVKQFGLHPDHYRSH